VGRVSRDALLRSPDFLRYTGANAVSNLGSYSSSIAFPLLALALGASNGEVGLLVACELVARLVTRLPAGQLADAVDRRWLMLGSDLVRLVAFAVIPLVALVGKPTFGLILLVSVVEGVFGAIFAPAASAAIRDIVDDDDVIADALGKSQACYSVVALIGPAFGGWLFSVSHTLPFAVDAASYAISAALLLRLKTPPASRLPATERDRRFTAGWRWLATHAELRSVVLFGAVLNVASGATYITLVLSLREQGTSSTTIGIVLTCGGAGSLIGALFASRLIRVLSTKALIAVIGFVWTAGLTVLIGTPPVVITTMVFSALVTITPVGSVLLGSLLLTGVPRDLLGRVRSAIDVGVSGLAVLGPILAGIAIDRLGLPKTWLTLAILAVVPTLLAVRPRRFNRSRAGGLDTAAAHMDSEAATVPLSSSTIVEAET
jgi:MFS family permease